MSPQLMEWSTTNTEAVLYKGLDVNFPHILKIDILNIS
jgi:hypothetical protein